MFLEGLEFGLGLITGMSAFLVIIIGSVTLAERVKNWWHSESERARQEMAERAGLRKKMVDRAELTMTQREMVLVMVHHLSWFDEEAEPTGRRRAYIQ